MVENEQEELLLTYQELLDLFPDGETILREPAFRIAKAQYQKDKKYYERRKNDYHKFRGME